MRYDKVITRTLSAVAAAGDRIVLANLAKEVALLTKVVDHVERDVALELINLVSPAHAHSASNRQLIADTMALLGSKTGLPTKRKVPSFAAGIALPYVGDDEAREQLRGTAGRYCTHSRITQPQQVSNLTRTIMDQYGRSIAEAALAVTAAKSEWDEANAATHKQSLDTIQSILRIQGPSQPETVVYSVDPSALVNGLDRAHS